MINFKTIESMVAYCLMEWPETRNSDDALFARIAELKGVSDMPLAVFFLHRQKLKFPALETIRRTRQKLQERDPITFGADEETRAIRDEAEREYRKWATDLIDELDEVLNIRSE
jgi:hypothetical protein